MKVLFITEYIGAKGQGAYMVANAHYQSFCDIFGVDNVDVINIKSSNDEIKNDKFYYISAYENRIDRLKNLLCGYQPFYNNKINNYILGFLKENKYDLIYFDNCYFGNITKKIKKLYPNIPIWVFFHGIKANSGRQTIKNSHFKPQVVLACINNIFQEKKAVKYSDKLILLNKRDEDELLKYYNKKADMFLPVYYKDTAKIEKVENHDEFRILFLGGHFWPNVHGITWFAENVMPYVDKKAKLYVVGRGMEVLKENDVFSNSDNINVVGGTDDLDYWYNSSDITVGPIFHGDGMKTKTAEALMYGKKYIGTTEALCGYEGLDEFCVNTAEEFINIINKNIKDGVCKYNPEMRKLYDDNYSVESANRKIRELLNEEGFSYEK